MFSLLTSLFAVEIRVKLIKHGTALKKRCIWMGAVYSDWRYQRPDSCSIPSKMESWLQSIKYKFLSANRGFSEFFTRHSAAARQDAPVRVPADKASSPFLRQKTLNDSIRQGYF